jgi:hypothetical protein
MKNIKKDISDEDYVGNDNDIISIVEIMKMQLESGAFDFLYNEKEDIYNVNDLKVKYK